ncbi:metal-dependent hydrolase [Alteromonas sp. LMIT006]|uniref:metal-dependent hydrolase n=1 Tax=Alteromonadaceae TaxID=72275 RepID=UPI0020CA9430|nr:metal-dependent hydrolase [Alteromonas sp. LMIT006]UTP72987.1 metal-dependent hydrolase [Alteromonas sp. LMIT006]
MDSITQIALGATVGYAIMGSKVGRRAALYGAVLGTLPDLDVLIPYGGDIENFTYHRGFSHSFLVHALISPILAWLFCKLHPQTKTHFAHWAGMAFTVLATHSLIDGLTVYGTQVFWGLTEYPFAYSIFFIIDPLYTLPLLIPTLFYLMPRISLERLRKLTFWGLGISVGYMLWAIAAKQYIDYINQHALAAQGIDDRVYVSTPAPLTTLLWRSVVVEDDAYYEIYTSIFDYVDEVSITRYPTEPELLKNIADEWHVQRLQWFTKGLYSVKQVENEVILTDLRMGVENAYVFTFAVGQVSGSDIVLGDLRQIENRPSFAGLPLILQRIVDPAVQISTD